VTTAEIIDLFKQATADLLWSSESDYPFEIVTWDRGIDLTPTALFSHLAAPDLAIEQITLSELFAPVLTIEDWYEAEELAQVGRYTDLLHAIESNLTDVRVFRVGSIEIAIYIVGKTPNGDLIGLKTHVVET
jgi:Nuclease A inhibitor-like protein